MSDIALTDAAAAARERTFHAVGELVELAQGLLRASVRVDLEEAGERLREGRLNLVVLGEFKRGKSTLVNALVGRELLPVGSSRSPPR